MKTIIIILLCVQIALIPVYVWTIGSLVTSIVKTTTDSCHKIYPTEKVFSGNWFCPTEKETGAIP